MDSQQFALQPNTIVDIAFQKNNINYNIHINTITGLIILKELNKKEPLLIHLIENKEEQREVP